MSEMIEVKTSDLAGPALDWAVAKACEMECEVKRNASGHIFLWRPNPIWEPFRPSTDWSQGGPLIEKFRICVEPCAYDRFRAIAAGMDCVTGWTRMTLESPLIHVCRAIVAAKLGDTISVPAELLNHA